jgi:hypothetical protein
VGGQSLLGLLAVGGGPGQLTAAVAGGLIELAAEPVPLGPQLRCDSRWRSGLPGVSMARVWPSARDGAWAAVGSHLRTELPLFG